MSSVLPPDVWDQIDHLSRISCCRAQSSEKCEGFHHQGTRVVYGYEILCRSVMSSLKGSRNAGLNEAINEVSKLIPTDGMVRKSDVLVILSGLKWPM